MYVSRLPFYVVPGKTNEVERQLGVLKSMIAKAGGDHTRILRSHFASDGAPDVVLEQDVDDLSELEQQIKKVTSSKQFQEWSRNMSPLLTRAPKREALLVVEKTQR